MRNGKRKDRREGRRGKEKEREGGKEGRTEANYRIKV